MLKLYKMWESSAARWSETIAVVEKDRKVNYKELDLIVDNFSNNLACQGVAAGDKVAIYLYNSIDYIICMLAAWKNGATIVPIMNDNPIARVEYIIHNADVSFIIMDDKKTKDENIITREGVKTVYLNELLCESEKKVNLNHTTNVVDNEIAYLMYTSGTSGVPKGVMIDQNSLINVIDWYINTYHITAGIHTANLASIGFDVSMEEILGTLFSGGTLYLPNKKEKSEKNLFKNFIESNSIHIVQLVPTLLNLLIGENPKLNCLNTIICGGEAMTEELKNKILAMGYELFNHYGPTEATIDTTYSKCKLEEPVNIGHPISNAECFVINENNELKDRNCEGELYIFGDGVAPGYVNNKAATEQCFKLIQGKRAYQTGDYVQIDEEGRIYFKGRKDTQIELNGIRIEIQEIENYIRKEKLLNEFSVCINSDELGDELILFYVSDKNIDTEEFAAKLRLFLPNSMTPRKYIRVKQLPASENGKLIRKLHSYEVETTLSNTSNMETNDDETTAAVIRKIAEIMETDPSKLSSASKLSNMGLESITFVRIVVELEELFDIEFEDDMLQFSAYATINDIVQYINNLIEKR